MSDTAFPFFYKEGGAHQGLHLRHLTHTKKKFEKLICDPRRFAAQDNEWARRYAPCFPDLEEKWVATVESQLGQVGVHLRQLWDDQFLFQIRRRAMYPKVQIVGTKVYLNQCPLCRTTSVELSRLPEGVPAITHSYVQWVIIGFVDPELCSHHVPIDDVSWKIIQNQLFLQSQGR